MTLNTAGSPTYALHLADPYANEVSIGSAFVKPTHFDLPTLKRPAAGRLHRPAGAEGDGPGAVPAPRGPDRGAEPAGPQQPARLLPLRRLRRRAAGLAARPAVQRPSMAAAAMLAGSAKVELAQDDFVFMRPTESEGVFLQFGDIAVYDGAGDQRLVADLPHPRVRRARPLGAKGDAHRPRSTARRVDDAGPGRAGGDHRRPVGHPAHLRGFGATTPSSPRAGTPRATGCGSSTCGASAGSGCCRRTSARPTSTQDRATRLFLYRGDMDAEWAAYGPDAQGVVRGLRRRDQRLCRRRCAPARRRCRWSSG